MMALNLFGFEAQDKFDAWCGRRDLNPHGPCGPTDFLATTAFAAAHRFRNGVWGLDYPFTVPGFASGCQVLPV